MKPFFRSPFAIFGAAVVAATAASLLLVPTVLPRLFSTDMFMPHIHCYLDNPRMVLLQGGSDFLIGLSYLMISGALSYIVYKARRDIPFRWMFLAFGIFIFSCGCTHFLEVWTLWNPTYWFSGSVKLVTAAASLATAVGVFYIIPNVFNLIQTAKVSEQRRQQLSATHADLQTAYKDLETFSYSLSHDLRGPLRTVHSFSELLLQDGADKFDEDSKQMLTAVHLAARRMDRLITDVLKLSRLSRVEIHNQTVDLEALLRPIMEARRDLQPPQATVHLRRPLHKVLGDPASLGQCLDNLLGNAVKFVPSGVQPEVTVHTERAGGRVRIYVQDNGIGIAPDQQKNIFEPFKRLHSHQTYEGTGIGLAIVSKAVDRMGGMVGVESEPGKGSRFWVELDAAVGESGND